MAIKKKEKQKQTKAKKVERKRAAPRKKLAQRTPRRKARLKKTSRGKSQAAATVAFAPEPRARSGGQSGDLQELSRQAGADSESVDELLEEGNAFEAAVVKGVEDAAEESEVVTHEVPEDDVPEEYLDKDR